ncbi:hypothetical protein [Ammoniphilus sp. YIM 78166]|uniref:hypothetical protein n=1 Tax=Ammoniphilus sp. YIM 78166 TaxID=1644106 RepID=UPI00106F3EF7|nr:hypothetical protein [Ammoniphilus sp. YIM 78166]
MSDELLAIHRKIKSTEEELKKLKKQLSPNSTEYIFSSAVLVKRLLEFKEQERELEASLSEDVIGDLPIDTLVPDEPEEVVPPTGHQEPVNEKLRLILSGKDIGRGSIPIRTLSSILHSLQSITDQIAYSIQRGPLQTDYIPAHVLRQSDLTIKHTFPGSFGLELVPAVDHASQTDQPLLSQSFHQLFDLFSSSQDANELLEQAAAIGPRTLNLYRKWMNFMVEQEVSMAFEWERPSQEAYRFTANQDEITSILKAIDSIRIDRTEELESIGSFVGMNLRENTFEILEQETNTVIKGRARRDMLLRNRGFLGDMSKLKLAKCSAQNLATGKNLVLWHLIEMKPLTTG